MALSYINNKEIKFGSSKPLNGVYTPGSPTREYEPLDSLGIYLNSGIPLSYGVENGRYMSMSDEFAATSQGNSYSFNQLFAAQMMLGFKLHDRFIACDTEHKIIGTEPLLHKAYLAEITEKTLDYFKIKIYEDKTRTFCIRMSSSEVPTSYVDLTNSFDENGLNLTQTDRQSFLSYYRFYPLTARDPSSRFEETLGVDYYLLPSAEGLKELSGDILSKFNAFISSDGTLTSLGNTAFAYAGDIGYVPNYRGETSEAAVSAAKKAEVILGHVEEMHADINQLLPEMEENLELTKQYRDEAMSTEIGTVRTDLNAAKQGLQELDDKKITKFYASNNGNTSLTDSDNGKPTDMKIFGKSVQDGTPSPSNPIEIQSVVNPVVRMVGKNLLNPKYSWVDKSGYTNDGITYSYNTDKVLTLNGTKLGTNSNYLGCFNLNLYFSGVLTITIFNYSDKTIADDIKVQIGNTSNIGTLLITNLNFLFGISAVNGKTYDNKKYVIQIEQGNISNPTYKPYQEQSASLPYTLNAIPVSSGGNVTIDGKQYVADYVDVERRKLVRMVRIKTITDSSDTITYNESNKYFSIYVTDILQTNVSQGLYVSKCNKYKYDLNIWNDLTIENGYITNINNLLIRDLRFSDVTSFRNSLQSNPIKLMHRLATPTETDLTESDITELSSLATYYPVTNVSVASSQFDGCAIFNYPLNMANGWNYVMQQIGETRPIIYDTQVKTIENIIDTAILTAMMEA